MRSRRLLIALIAVAAVFMTFVAAVPPIAYDGEPALVANPVDHVDTLIGTGTGGETVGEINNFPGPSVPFGMVQYSPDTTDNYAGYSYDNPALHRVQHDPRLGGLCGVWRHLDVAYHHLDRIAALERLGTDRPRRHRAWACRATTPCGSPAPG